MLQNKPPGTSDDAQSTDIPVSQRRVTPQELTRALVSLGAQKEEAERRREELSRGPTPERIWAEMLALRADNTAPARSAVAQPRMDIPHMDGLQNKKWVERTLIIAALACSASALAVLARAPASSPRVSLPLTSPVPAAVSHAGPYSVTTPDAEFYRKLNLSQGPHPQYRILLRSVWGMPPAGATPSDQTVYPLSAVPDGCLFYKPQFTGVSFGMGGYAGSECVFEEVSARVSPVMWMMTRYNGRYYQHTWIRRGDIVRLVQGNALDLYPTPFVQDERGVTPLTLAVGSHPANCYTGSARNTFQPCFQDTPLGPIMQLPEGAKATLDSHAWENFLSSPQRQYQPPPWDKEPGTFVSDRNGGFGAATDFDASSQVEPFGAVPDGEPVHCSSVTLGQMLHIYPYLGTIPQVLVDARPHLDRAWTVINLGGRPYLHGWIADRPTRPLPISRDLAVASNTRAPEFVNPPVQITLPLNGLVWHRTEGEALPTPGGPGTGGKIIVANVRLDQHAWDKW